MSTESLDRTARWVQAHTQSASYRQHSAVAAAAAVAYQQPNARSRTRIDRQPDGLSSEQSSRTDLGGQDYGVGSKGRSHHARTSSTAMAVAGSSYSHAAPLRRAPEPEPLLTTSTPHPHPHQRARSHSHSHSHSQSASMQTDQSTQPRLNIHSSLYRHPQLPAFVQGPPGSGYPMSMSTATARPVYPQQPARVAVPSPSSPPLLPTPLNPKKSRPTVQKRRPSLSGATFNPLPAEQYAQSYPTYQYHHGPPEMREPRAQGQGPGDGYRMRGRSSSEVRRGMR